LSFEVISYQSKCHLACFAPKKKNCHNKDQLFFKGLSVLSFMAEYLTFATRFKKIFLTLKSG